MNLKKYISPISFCFLLGIICSCIPTFKMTGTTLDYTKIKTLSIENFQNRSTLVYGPLMSTFNNELIDTYRKQTRLEHVKTGGDLHLEGEIISYDLKPLSIKSDALAAETRLTITVNVRFTNNVNEDESFEKNFSAYQDFESTKMLSDVQDELISLIITDLVDMIFNATVANW